MMMSVLLCYRLGQRCLAQAQKNGKNKNKPRHWLISARDIVMTLSPIPEQNASIRQNVAKLLKTIEKIAIL
jgi:hypothetical protein